MKKHHYLALGLLALILLGVAGAGYLFRSEEVENEALGLLTYHYRWGHRRILTADTNRDGKTDFRARINSLEVPEEFWEDRDHDGVFELHVLAEGHTIQQVDLDRDGDGRYEVRFKGAKAHTFYQENYVSTER